MPGNYDEAMPLYARALAIFKASLEKYLYSLLVPLPEISLLHNPPSKVTLRLRVSASLVPSHWCVRLAHDVTHTSL